MAHGTTINLTPTSAPAAGLVSVPHQPRTTAHDALDRLLDYLGANPEARALKECRRAFLDAHNEFANYSRWSYLKAHGRIRLEARYSTGTVTYTHTGGAFERLLTLAGSGAVWPSWANYGYVRIGNVTHKVDRRIDDTRITLDATLNPGANVAAGTAYKIYRDTYTLPADFIASDYNLAENHWGGLSYIPFHDWLARTRYLDTEGEPRAFTICGDPQVGGRLAIRVSPVPDTAQTLDFTYQRKMRDVKIWDYSTGKATVDHVAAATRVTQAGGAFTSDMKGSVIRLGSDATNLPTGRHGLYPYSAERTILVVDSATQVTVDESFTASLTSVAYRVSDPVDVEDGAMITAFFRLAESHLNWSTIMKNKAAARAAFEQALILAMEADSRMMGERAAGNRWRYRQRLADMPRGADIS